MTDGWQTRTLGEVLEKIETVDPLRSPEAEFDYIDVSSVSNLTFRIQDTQRLKGKDAPSRARRRVRAGDVLLATVRPTLRRIAVVPGELDGQVCSTGYYVLRPKPDIDHRYIFYWLLTDRFMDSMANLQTGASYPAVTDGQVRAQPISFPALPEQRRIVAILDEAFADIAVAKANAESNLQNVRAAFESHLRAVFTQLDGHNTVPISEVGQVFDGPHATPKTVEAGPVFLGIGALQDGRVNLGETRHVTPEDFQRWTRRVKPQADDFVFSYETRLGQAALIPEGLECCLGRRMGLLRLDRSRVDPRFFAYQYISPPYREFLATRTVRGATVDRILIKEFPSFPIVLPPLPEQQRLADLLAWQHDNARQLEDVYVRKVVALEALKKSLLHQAFTGQLTSRAA